MSNEILSFRQSRNKLNMFLCSICFDFVKRTKFHENSFDFVSSQNGNNVDATFDYVEATFDFVEWIVQHLAFDNVASIVLLMWTGLNVTKLLVASIMLLRHCCWSGLGFRWTLSVINWQRSSDASLSHWVSTFAYNTMDIRQRVTRVCLCRVMWSDAVIRLCGVLDARVCRRPSRVRRRRRPVAPRRR